LINWLVIIDMLFGLNTYKGFAGIAGDPFGWVLLEAGDKLDDVRKLIQENSEPAEA
jgi:hypothetical protein